MQCGVVPTCFIKHLRGFILVLLVLWCYSSCRSALYLTVYVPALAQPLADIAFSRLEGTLLLRGSESAYERDGPQKGYFKTLSEMPKK